MSRTHGIVWALWMSCVAAAAPALPAAGQQNALPSGAGLAAAYPGDRGITDDRRVVFAEDFEAGDGLPDVLQRWHEASNRADALALVKDGPVAGVPAGRAIQITARVGQNTGGHLYKRLDRPLDRAFARFYVKFPDDAGYVHHFVHLGGYRPATTWPQGGAGSRSGGGDRFTIGIEPFGRNARFDPPGVWNSYAYWCEMKVSADGRYWGNGLAPKDDTPMIVPRGRWQCVEVMVQCNDPAKRDGELALWLDGELKMHIRPGSPRARWTGLGFRLLDEGDPDAEPFEGFRWRTTDELKVNFFWLLHYVTESALRRNGVTDFSKPNHVRFDNIVVASQYVGPVKAAE